MGMETLHVRDTLKENDSKNETQIKKLRRQ